MRSSVGGEIGEAPPVADEASRFRGSAPIGGHDSARQSVGTTVGKRAPPLRKRNKNCGEAGRRGRRPLQSSIGEWCVGADVGIGLLTALLVMCHCETSSQTGRGERTERCQWQKKRGERVAAVKISSVRRKAAQKFWAPQQGHPHPRPHGPPCLKRAADRGIPLGGALLGPGHPSYPIYLIPFSEKSKASPVNFL